MKTLRFEEAIVSNNKLAIMRRTIIYSLGFCRVLYLLQTNQQKQRNNKQQPLLYGLHYLLATRLTINKTVRKCRRRLVVGHLMALRPLRQVELHRLATFALTGKLC